MPNPKLKFTHILPSDFKIEASNKSSILVFAKKKTLQGKSFGVSSELKARLDDVQKVLNNEFEDGEFHFWPAITEGHSHFALQVLGDKNSKLGLLESFRDALKSALVTGTETLTFVSLDKELDEVLAHALGVAIVARILPLPDYGERAKKQKSYQLKEVELVTSKETSEVAAEGYVFGEGSHLVRSLGITPPNLLDPKKYGAEIRKLCAKHKLKVKFYSRLQLKKMGAGAFLAVDQADPQSGGGIYELEYKPTKRNNKKPIALVGKGLCFDTGGYDIKTSGYMAHMKGDMQGSAVVLSTLIAASKLKWPLHLKGWLAVTENHISPRAYKQDDVVTAINGRTIEVTDTDAEGRMVLADTLALATKEKPEICIDFATLTGSAVRALGTRYGAAFSNEIALHDRIKEKGVISGERMWTFPLDDDYGKVLESKVADTIQCSRTPGPDHILAAYFLSKFIENGTPWVHVDLAAAENDGGLGGTDNKFTGFGVLWALEYLRP